MICDICWTWAREAADAEAGARQRARRGDHHPNCPALGLPLDRAGLPYRDLPDGRRLTAMPLTYGAGRLGLGVEGDEMRDLWDFETLEGAVRAVLEWDPVRESEPSDWSRHPDSGRRRPGGDAGKEYVNL